MADTFKITYEVDDGYVGGKRPHSIIAELVQFEGVTREEARSTFWEMIEEDMRQHVRPVCPDEDEFMAWLAVNLEDF